MLRFLTAGESHGPALTVIIEGLPKGLYLTDDYINLHLKRRQGGYGRGGRQKIEKDAVRILSGVRFGLTLGSPLTLQIENRDFGNWVEKMQAAPLQGKEPPKPVTAPRPGHADLAGVLKYGDTDIRNILERASARETAARVAVGSVCRRLLEEFGIRIVSFVVNIGGAAIEPFGEGNTKLEDLADGYRRYHAAAEQSPVRCPDKKAEARMIERIKAAQKEKDTVGGVFEVAALGVPPGLGSFMHWDKKLDGRLAQAFMSIPAIKGVEIGLGFEGANRFGTQAHDPIYYAAEVEQEHSARFYRTSNNAGGLEAGLTNGEPVVVRAAMKPIATTMKGLPSVDILTKEAVISHKERSDVCAVPAASVVGEAMMAIVLAQAFLEKFAGDTVDDVKGAHQRYLERLQRL